MTLAIQKYFLQNPDNPVVHRAIINFNGDIAVFFTTMPTPGLTPIQWVLGILSMVVK
jgi:hypothetical protein